MDNKQEPKFSEKEIKHVKEAYTDYQSGNLYTQEQAQKRFDQWMSEK